MRVRNRLAMGIVGVLPLLGAAPRCGRERNEKCSMPARACDLRSVRVKNHVCGITHFDRIRKKMEADRASLLLIRQDPAKSEDPAKKNIIHAVGGNIGASATHRNKGIGTTATILPRLRGGARLDSIMPSLRGFRWLPRFSDGAQTAIGQFCVRTLARGRQHRLVTASDKCRKIKTWNAPVAQLERASAF